MNRSNQDNIIFKPFNQMSNNQNKYIALPGGKECKPVNPYNEKLRNGLISLDYKNFEVENNRPIPITEVMPEGETFEGEIEYKVNRKEYLGTTGKHFDAKMRFKDNWIIVTKEQYDVFSNEETIKAGLDFQPTIAIKPLKAKEPVNSGSTNKGMCDAKPPMLEDFLSYPPEYSDRDWKEDFSHENGNYACKCSAGCGKMFYGHKRRVLCRTCAIPKPICGENCGCTGPEDCYGEAGLNLVEKLANENTPPSVDVVENKESVEQMAHKLLKPYWSHLYIGGTLINKDQLPTGYQKEFKATIVALEYKQPSIEGIVGFVLEKVAEQLFHPKNNNTTLLDILTLKSDIIKEYNNGK